MSETEKQADFSKIENELRIVTNNFFNIQSEFFKFIKPELDKWQNYKRRYIDKTDQFNFFESISDKWYRENFHSDILYTILNPNTEEIGRKYFVEEFVKFLGIEDRFDCKSDFEVLKEESTGSISWTDNSGNKREKVGGIDLLIKNKEQAIIIENKINYAPDMENQLVRYMKYVDETLKIETYTVVYLTLINDGKKPPLDNYDNDFKKYTEKLKDKNSGILKEVYAVDDKKSIEKDFLSNCCKRIEEERSRSKPLRLSNNKLENSCNIASVYINQYKTLLEHLGGKSNMLVPEKELIRKIYANKDSIENAESFTEIWEKKDEIIQKLFNEEFSETHKDWIFEYNVFYKKIGSYWIYVCWEIDKNSPNPNLGFWSEKELENSDDNMQNEKKILEKKFADKEVKTQGNDWVFIDFPYNNEPITESFERIIKATEKLEQSVEDAIENGEL